MNDVAKRGRALPSGTVTFLLTDVAGSSRMWEEHPDLARAAVARSREIVAAAVAAHAGAQPVEQGEGDNVVAAFARASDGLTAAAAAQSALGTEPWPVSDGVQVRMALHSGEAVPNPDGTYAGAVLNRCARLRALAHGGQVVVSGATRNLAVDQLPDGLALLDLGMHRLRDLSRPEHVWQLAADGLTTDFPPLRSLDTAPNNLPVQLSSFIGRDQDIALCQRLLSESRLVTLTGTGGCGKTRLALRVAGESSADFADGVWWVELAPVTEPAHIPTAVAAAMGVRIPLGREPLQAVLDELAEQSALVVLDNCEHLVAAAADFADRLLRTARKVKVLATSREALTVEGEITWRVPSLAVPPTVTDVDALGQYDAVRLFIDRAVQVRPNFTATNDNAPAIAEICSRLDGIPLAIELAAARTRVLSPERIAEQLGDRFRLLAGGARTALPRQQTLLASIDWSHDLLDADERVLLRRLGVFAGGFTLDAAEAVVATEPLDGYRVLDVLDQLVTKSLVQVDDVSGERYWLLETIRQYALDRLADAGESESIAGRHVEWAVELAESLESGTLNIKQDAMKRLSIEHANIRAALDNALAAGDKDGLLRLIAAFGPFWGNSGLFTEGRRWIAEIPEVADKRLLARANAAGSYVLWFNYDLLGAAAMADLALEQARGCGDRATAARGLLGKAWASMLPAPATSRACAIEGEQIATEVGDRWCRVMCRLSVAVSHYLQGRADEAEAALDDAAPWLGDLDGDFQRGAVHLVRGYAALNRADLPTARVRFNQSFEFALKCGAPTLELWPVAALAYAEFVSASFDGAKALIERLAAEAKQWGLLGDIMIPTVVASIRFDDAPEEVHASQSAVGELALAINDVSMAASTFGGSAMAALEMGDVPEARRLATRCLDDAARYETMYVVPLYICLARAALHEGAVAEAEEHAQAALTFQAERGMRLYLADTLDVLGMVAVEAESAAEGIRLSAAADAFRAVTELHRVNSFQREVDARRDAARAALGDDYDSAWAAGTALTVDEAVAYARRARGERKRPSHGWASLTPTELEVVRLAASGLTNAEVGKQLFIGAGTVKTHLAHAYAKLGIGSRAELATLVAKHDAM